MAQGDLDTPEPFRKYAQYWLPGDELGTGRAMGNNFEKIYKHSPVDLIAQIKAIYAAAETRKDVEDTELQYRNEYFCQLPPLSSGLQVHEPYKAYAHWMLLRFANYPLTYEDILWPGEQIPKRKRRRRKGRTIAAMRQTAA